MNWDEPARTHDEPDPPSVAVPEVISARRFDEHDLLGTGASGRIVRAVDTRLARDVALKIVGPEQPRALARLRREASVLATLEHPGIVPIYDVLERADGGLQLALRIIRGRTLEAALAADYDRKAMLVHLLRASEAMAHAHARGFVHRDLKPANVMLGEFGETQVIDWGLACPVGSERSVHDNADGSQPDDPRLTRAGSVVGTPAYMPPEQARGARVDERADVWALGAMLFEIATGQKLVMTRGSSESAEVVLEALRAGYVPDRSRLGVLPRDLLAIARRALMADPERRHSDAGEFAADLKAALARPGRRVRIALALLAAVGIGGAFVLAREDGVPLMIPTTTVVDSADEELAAANALEASRLMSDGHRPDAAAAAARSLLLAPNPRARGVLATLDLERAPRLVHEAPVPSCREVDLAKDGEHWLCRTEAELRLFAGDTPQWSVRRAFTTVAFLRDEVLAISGDSVVSAFARDTGKLVRTGTMLPVVFDLDTDLEERYAFVAVRGNMQIVGLDPDPRTIIVREVQMHSSHNAVMFPDGRAAMTVSPNLLITKAPNGDERRVTSALTERFAPDRVNALTAFGEGFAVGTMLGEVLLLDADGNERAVLELDPPTVVRSLVASPSGKRLALRTERSGPIIIDEEARIVERLPRMDSGALRFVDDRHVVTIGERRAVWELPAEAPVDWPVLRDLNALASDGRYLGVGHGPYVTLVDVESGASVARHACNGTVMSVAFTPAVEASELAYVANLKNPELRLALPSLEPIAQIVDESGGRRVTYDSRGRAIIASFGKFFEEVWPADIDVREPVLYEAPFDVMIRDDDLAVLTRSSRELLLVDAVGMSVVGRCADLESRTIALGADRETLYSGQRDAVVALDARSCDVVHVYQRPDRGDDINDIDASGDGAWVAAGTRDGKLFVWRTDGELAATMELHGARIAAIAFDPMSRWLVAGTIQGQLMMFDLGVLDAEPKELARRVESAWGL